MVMMMTNDCPSEVFLVVCDSEEEMGQGVSKLLRGKVIKIIILYIRNLVSLIHILIVKIVC